MSNEKDPDNIHILDPAKDKHTNASGTPSAPVKGVVCNICGGKDSNHRNCGKSN